MNITLKQMRYFDAAIRGASIVRAAEEMNISQSSITAAIDQIEHSVGTELFRRIPAKGIVATQTGKEVGIRIAAFLEQARVLESDLMSMTGNPTGTLRLACFEPTAPYVLPPLLRRIADSYPEIRIDIMEGDMAEISAVLRAGTVDAALTYHIETHPEHHFVPLFNAPPWALVPENSALAGRSTITVAELANVPLIALDMPGTREYFSGLFQSHGLVPNVVHSTKSGAVLRGLVSAQFGHAILNICGPSDRENQHGYLAIPVADKAEEPIFGVAYAPQLEQSAVVRAVITIGKALASQGSYDHLLLRHQ